jgi:hypothetical protein
MKTAPLPAAPDPFRSTAKRAIHTEAAPRAGDENKVIVTGTRGWRQPYRKDGEKPKAAPAQL